MTDHERIVAGLKALQAIADAIRELGHVPSGHLYAHLCGVMSLHEYECAINILKQGFVKEENNELVWIGPK